MTNADKLSAAAQRVIDEHLDAIEASLRASGVPRSERQGVVDNVENQINEMLAARVAGTPTEEDVRALIAGLDAPESFVEAMGPPATEVVPVPVTTGGAQHARISKCAVIGALWSIGIVFPVLFVIPVLFVVPVRVTVNTAASDGLIQHYGWLVKLFAIIVLLIGASAPLGTTLLGFVSLSHIRRSAGALYGRRLALYDALVYPLLAAIPVGVGLAATGLVLSDRPGEFFDLTYNHHWKEVFLNPLVWSLGIGLWVLVAGAVIWWSVRRVRRP